MCPSELPSAMPDLIRIITAAEPALRNESLEGACAGLSLEELLREVRRLRNIFRAAGLNARAFRRRLRAKGGGNRFTLSEARRLRRSKNAKQVFVDAEHFAAIANSPVYPTHLLYAALLTDDESRDTIINELAIDKNRLRQVAKREALLHHNAEFLQPDIDRTNLN